MQYSIVMNINRVKTGQDSIFWDTETSDAPASSPDAEICHDGSFQCILWR